jgi:shikimate kinase
VSVTSSSSRAGVSLASPPTQQSVVLIGMMGAGKTSIGLRLSRALGLPFRDADREIELAAGTSIANIFAEIGEQAFRQSERQIIARLLAGERHVLALGGGAFMDPATRARVRERATSIWLRAGLDELVRRTARRNDRPLLHGVDPRARLHALLEERAPVYAEADLVVDSDRAPIGIVVETIVQRLRELGTGADP